MSNHQTWFKNS